MKKLEVKSFGSGFAVFNGDERLTPAFDENIAYERKLMLLMESIGAVLIHNTANRTTDEIIKEFKHHNIDASILKVELNNKIYRFTI